MQYVEIMQYIEYYTIDQLKERLDHYKKAISEYAYILHDKDKLPTGEDKAPHFHCIIKFNDGCDYPFERLAKMFKLEKQYLNHIKKSYANALAYITHRTDTAKHKHQYDFDEVKSNFDYATRLAEISAEVKETRDRKDEIDDLLTQFATFKLSRNALIEHLTPLEYDKNKRRIDNMSAYRNEKTKKEQRNMRVIYISGTSSSGKTTLAKYMASTLGYDFFVSGSGKDPLDGYDNEEAIILDDLRADVFTKAELFKLLDNNTGSAVKSRYYNKAINHCKIIFITSIKAPSDLYEWNANDKDESPKQFARRLDYTSILIRPNGKVVQRALNDELRANGDTEAPFDMEAVYLTLGIVKKSKGITDLLQKVAESTDLPF